MAGQSSWPALITGMGVRGTGDHRQTDSQINEAGVNLERDALGHWKQVTPVLLIWPKQRGSDWTKESERFEENRIGGHLGQEIRQA